MHTRHTPTSGATSHQRSSAITCLILAWLLGALCEAVAGHISLETSFTSRLEADVHRIDLMIANRGTDPAEYIRAQGHLGDLDAQSPACERLLPGESCRVRLIFDAPSLARGEHTVVATIRYEDERGHPFSVLRTIPVFTDIAESEPPVTGTIEPLSMQSTGVLKLTLANRGLAPVEGRLRLCLPDELLATNDVRNIALSAKQVRAIPFRIENQWAQPGSVYRIVAVLDYPASGYHRSSVITGSLRIEPKPQLPEYVFKAGYLLAGLLALAFVAAQYRRINSSSCSQASRRSPPAQR